MEVELEDNNQNIESNPEQEEANRILKETMDNVTPPDSTEDTTGVSNNELAFAPVTLDQDETKDKIKLDQLAIDNELQRMVRENETVYKSQLSKLYNHGLKFELKGQDPVGINGCVFVPYTIYTVGNRIISPDGVFLITNDLMQCALGLDSAAMQNEKKITTAGGGSIEITEKGGVVLQTTKT